MMSTPLSSSLLPLSFPKLHTPTLSPLSRPAPNIFVTLSFDKHQSSISNDPIVDYANDLAQLNPKNGTINTKISESLHSNGALIRTPQSSVVEPQLSYDDGALLVNVDEDDSLPYLPAILPPSQLSLAELLRHDFENTSHLPAAVCNAADTLITSLLSPAQLNPSVDPLLQLVGNCAPVAETPPTPCSIRGTLPPGLNGVYIRNGPNATHLHRGDGYHYFDGNGMLHSVKLENGRATFCARYVKTARYLQEVEAGRPLFPKFFGGLSGISGMARTAVLFVRAALGLVKVSEGWGLSNTSVGFFNGQVLSFSEDGMPYAIKVTESGDLVTLGHMKLPGKLNMCAHPKFDTFTGEMFGFSFINPSSLSLFSLFRVSADGIKSPDIPVPLFDVPLVHDFALTRRYVIFPDNQLVVRPIESLKGESALVCDAEKTPRFCLLPRYALPEEAAQKAQWFDVPGCNCLHYINAWEEGPDEVVLITPVLAPPELILELPAVNTTCTLSEVRLNTATGTARRRKVCVGNFEFGTLNQKYMGKKSRYVYLASGCFPELTGVVKVDLQAGAEGGEAVVGRRVYGDGCTGGEPFFVAREGKQLAEDDGYVLSYVHDQGKATSELLVMDALSPTLRVIARVQLPSRVPSGFHGWFITQKQLSTQA